MENFTKNAKDAFIGLNQITFPGFNHRTYKLLRKDFDWFDEHKGGDGRIVSIVFHHQTRLFAAIKLFAINGAKLNANPAEIKQMLKEIDLHSRVWRCRNIGDNMKHSPDWVI